MALNGLDEDTLRQHLHNAQAHESGWLLLKYKARDEVEMLAAGTGGYLELSAAVASYGEPSPLYGYLRYRQRNALLKIIPEGTSRLLQARTTVHFQSFSDAFESHDGVLSVISATEINEFALSEVCSLTIPEGIAPPEPEANPVASDESEYAPQTTDQALEPSTAGDAMDTQHSKISLDGADASTDFPASAGNEARPSTAESHKYSLSGWRPKVKLFTRPISDERVAKTTENSRQALPQGMRILPRRGESERPRSSRSQRSVNLRSPDASKGDAPPVPPLPSTEASPNDATNVASRSAVDVANEISLKPSVPFIVSGGVQQSRDKDALARFEAFDAADALPRVENTVAERQRLMKALEQRRNRSDSGRGRSEKVVQLRVSEKAAGEEAKNTTAVDASSKQGTAESIEQMVGGKAIHATHESLAPRMNEDTLKAASTSLGNAETAALLASNMAAEAIQHNPGAPRSELESMSDDSLLDELQTAQVQKATPIAVSHPPRSPVVDGGVQVTSAGSSINPITVGSVGQSTSPNTHLGRARTVSHMSKASQDTLSLARVGNVSKGISQRIQALAENSSREPSPNSQQRELLNVGSFGTRPSSRGSDINRISSRSESRPHSPAVAAAPRKPKVWTINISNGYSAASPSATTNSEMLERRAPTSHGVVNKAGSLYKAFSREDSKIPQDSSLRGKAERPLSPQKSRPSSRDSSRTNLTRQSAESSWKFLGRRRTEDNETRPPTGQDLPASVTLEKVDENGSEAKQSRAGRLLKRVSGLPSSSKKHERGSDQDSRGSKAAASAPAPFSLGDLNVQFPDSLLWKRRWVEVDAQGYLVFSATRANERPRGNSRKYHFNEFRAPIVPSHDRQELSNSIMLDISSGGGTLQLAFQDAVGQQHFMRKLMDGHSGWSS